MCQTLDGMTNRSRGLRERVVRGLAKVGLVWALAVLATLFMVSSAQGQSGEAYVLASSGADVAASFAPTLDVPREAGMALALMVLAAGMTVLAAGSMRAPSAELAVSRVAAPESDPDPDLPLAMALGMLS